MDDLSARNRDHLAVLVVTFPGWRIVVRKGIWWATKHVPPTDAQKAAGIHHQLARPSALELATALSEQLGILMRTRSA